MKEMINMCTVNAPHRHDTVGSFLRTERLKKARKDFEEGNINGEELTKIEDEEIKKMLKQDLQYLPLPSFMLSL